jgi:hypothetical protein
MTLQPQPNRKTGQIQMTANNNLVSLAQQLAADLYSDIGLAKTREEHIRVTARANAASALLTEMGAPLYEFTEATFTSGKDE